jgi:hypothetical protein
MKYECIYNANENVVEAVTYGKGDMTQLLEMMQCVLDLCGQQESANILIDYSELDAQSLTMENIETLGRRAAEKKDVCKVRKCANVVTNDLQFGLVRAWEIIVQLYDLVDLEIRLFKNRDEATEWIRAAT